MQLMNEQHHLMCHYSPDVGIPEVLTISGYTTGQEQLRLSSEGFHNVMINEILPKVIEPKIPIKELYEIDYYLILRRLRLATWGPFFTIGSYFCSDCLDETGSKGKLYKENKQIRLDTIEVIAPKDGKEVPITHEISRDELIFTDVDVTLGLNKCKHLLEIEKRKFPDHLKAMLPLAYAIRGVTGQQFIDIKEVLKWLEDLPPADFKIIHDEYVQFISYGLSSKGTLECPYCGGKAWFFVPVNDYYFRPTREDLKEWKRVLRDTPEAVRSSK